MFIEEKYATFLKNYKIRKEELKLEKEKMEEMIFTHMEQHGLKEILLPGNIKIKLKNKKTLTTNK